MSEAPATMPERRIKDAPTARTLFTGLRTDSESRRRSWAKVQGQIDGAPPLLQDKLTESGQGWRCNVNFRDASSTLEQVLIGYWRLLHDSTNLAAVTQHGDDPNSKKWEAIFQEQFNRFVDDWGSDYVRNYLLFSQNHVTWGVGTVIWNDTDSPRWETVRLGDLEVPEETKSSVDEMEIATIRQKMTVSKLWDLVRTPEKAKAAEAAGWNTSALKEVLARHVKDGHSNAALTSADVIEITEQIRNNSLGASQKHGPLKIVHMLVKEFDGKITRYIFAENTEHGNEYLFDDSTVSGRPTKMGEALACVFFEAGNGLFWGSKGFGVKNFPIASVTNRLKSRAVDRTLLDGLNFRDLSEGGRQTVPITNVGPFNFLPKDVEQIPSYPTGRSILDTIAMVDSQSNQNNARYRDQGRQIENTNTATQANILANLQAQVDVANATLYLKQIALSIFTEQFRRLRKRGNTHPDAVSFRKRCVDDSGMPEKVFHDAEISVRTGADPGAASIAVRAQAAKELLAFANNPNVNDRWAWETYIAGTFGAQAVDKALRPVDALGDLAAQRLALMENDVMGHGTPMPVDPKDNHAAHLPVHLQPLQVIVDQYSQSGRINPDSLVALQNAPVHVDQHFEYLKADKLQLAAYQQLWPQWSAIRNSVESIFKQIERMDNEAQRMQGGGQPGTFDPNGAVGALTQQQPG